MPDQSYAQHRRWVPFYHFVTAILLLVNAGWALWGMIRGFAAGTVIQFTTAFALVWMFYYLRAFPLAAQDRIIRLEERIRLARLLPPDMQSKVESFTLGQLVGLRFASDAELPELARKVLEENIQDREVIKKQVKQWRTDDLRM